ncbi:MAG: MFS transporter [Chloroflexi bacterium]|nr:MFS transporter [Chloroflexota bacterium]
METTHDQLWSRDFILLLGSTLLIWGSFYFILPTLPLYVVQRLHGNPAQVGLLSGMLGITAVIARPLSGWAADRWGRRPVQLLFLLLFAVVVLTYNFATSMAMLVLIRLLHGIPFGAATTAGMTVAADLVPASRRGEGIGYYALAQTLSMAVGPVLAFAILGGGHFSRLFLTTSLIAFAALMLAWAIRHPPVRNAHASFSWQSIFEMRVGWLALTALFIALGYSGIVSFVTLYGEQLHVGNAGLFFTLYALGMMLARPGTGQAFDRRGPAPVVAGGLAILFLAYLLLALWRTAMGFLCAGLLYGVGYGAVVPSIQAMAVNMVPAVRRGAANATVFSIFDIGMSVGPYLLGLLAQAMGGYAEIYLVAAALLAVPTLLFFWRVMPGYGRMMSEE